MKEYCFRFKEFSIRHRDSVMKVGTDSILLGAWCPLHGQELQVLDIGSGCGVIRLMLAQRLPHAQITGIEMDQPSLWESLENVKCSPWSDRVGMIHANIRDYHPTRSYDLIVANPPFFDQLLPADPERRRARHQSSMTHEDLLLSVDRQLISTGAFCTIIPADHTDQFLAVARFFNLYPAKLVIVKHRESKPGKRVMIQFKRQPMPVFQSTLIIGDENERSAGYLKLTEPFYLLTQKKGHHLGDLL